MYVGQIIMVYTLNLHGTVYVNYIWIRVEEKDNTSFTISFCIKSYSMTILSLGGDNELLTMAHMKSLSCQELINLFQTYLAS